MRTKILYEDKDIIVVHKPAGLATQSGRIGETDVVSELKNYLAAQSGKSPYVGVVHRLDQPVEGLLVFGKNQKASAALSAALGTSDLHKSYYAALSGIPPQKEALLEGYLCQTKEHMAKVVSEKDAGSLQAKPAKLSYQILWEAQEYSLAKIEIFTGRFHQIRAQMAHAGYPLLGDTKYGTARSKELSARLGVRTVALCACELSLTHPFTHQKMQWKIQPGQAIFESIPCGETTILTV